MWSQVPRKMFLINRKITQKNNFFKSKGVYFGR